ncbi:hypothetical protein LTR70_005485 [Exophiala xenobiotica]|uniref:NAD(P)-binding protein n=1 Tax=Lithohypha guttulata TaxID=1690604 RepID=A0ABR0KDS8_9EURO|nr:hypothetical protein LTR24_003852 [Lithohypha guttulata]KAK5318342.1 hypothetical protein LTR70_005485 [Exophiala xenobiotica]
MVSYEEVQASNSQIVTTLPAGLVAVFIGGTNGIGEYTLKQFARHTKQPRVYIIGRSEDAGDRIRKECETLNPNGSFKFTKSDTSLICNVDELCRVIKAREKEINLLFMTIGTLDFYSNTSEGLRRSAALVHFARARFIQNFLPELQAAKSLKRVVSVMAGTKEGAFDPEDINADRAGLIGARGHAASMVTMGMEVLAQKAPDVSFVHDFPGPFKSGIGREMPGLLGVVLRTLAAVIGPLYNIPNAESGAYHLFFATSAKYPPRSDATSASGVTLGEHTSAARGTDGNIGSGMYSIDEKGKSASAAVEQLLSEMRKSGTLKKLWTQTESEWHRITGSIKAPF